MSYFFSLSLQSQVQKELDKFMFDPVKFKSEEGKSIDILWKTSDLTKTR